MLPCRNKNVWGAIVDQTVAPAPAFASPPSAVGIVFLDQRKAFLDLILRGALLELFTIGFYRFWLATDIRRHLWRNTSIDGDTLEYTGTAKELFLGFVFALTILGPLYVVYFLAGLEAERYKAFASLPLALFYYLFIQFAIFRARRYRMTRTIWRGVRFWMTGSGWNYAFRAFGWMLLTVLTLGLVLPWARASLERFKMRHSHYGDLQGHFDGTGAAFFKQGFWLWALLMGLFVVLPIVDSLIFGKPILSVVVITLVSLFGMPFIYAAFQAIQWRWWISGVRFGDVSFSSELRAVHLYGLYWKVIGWSFLVYTCVGLAAGMVFGIFYAIEMTPGLSPEAIGEKMITMTESWAFLIPVAICYVAGFLLATAVARLFLIHDFTARLAATVTVHNIEAAQNVAALGEAANALGEGLANSLDIGF